MAIFMPSEEVFGSSLTMLQIWSIINRRHAYYIPVIVWGKDSRVAAKYSIGEYVSIKGRLQSREYIDKEFSKKTTYEVSAITIKRD